MNRFKANQKLLFKAETVFNLRPLEKYEIHILILDTLPLKILYPSTGRPPLSPMKLYLKPSFTKMSPIFLIGQKVRASLVSKLIELKEIERTCLTFDSSNIPGKATFEHKFFRKMAFSDFKDLQNQAERLERFHNQNHRYSCLNGQTPNEVLKK